MKRITLTLLCGMVLLQADAQPCPTAITVNSPAYQYHIGETAQFRVEIKGQPKNVTLTYNWSISSGEIVSGQGTPMIKVKLIAGVGSCTATVELGGLSRGCNAVASTSVDVTRAPEKVIGSNYTNAAALNDMVKKFITITHLNDLKVLQTAVINIYSGITTSPAELKNIHTAIAKAFEKNGVYSYQYTIIDAGVKKITAIEMCIAKEEDGKPVMGY